MRATTRVVSLPARFNSSCNDDQRRRQQNATSVNFGLGASSSPNVLALPTESATTQLWRMRRERLSPEPEQQENEEVTKVRNPLVFHSVVAKRKLAEDVMVAALRASKLGNMSSNQVAKSMPHFLDSMILKASLLKRQAGYAHLSLSTRLRFCIDQSRVVLLIRWLRHNKLTVSRIGEIVALGSDDIDTIRLRVEWLKHVNVKGPDLGIVFGREPSLMYSSFEELNQRVSLLENAGLRREWMGFVISRCPRVLTLNQELLLQKIELFVELGIDEYRFGTTVYRFPKLLGAVPYEDIQEKVDFLRGFGLEDHHIGKMIVSRPYILGSSMELAWQPVVKYLYYLGIERSGLRRILAVNPGVLCIDLAQDITPKVHFLRAIGVHEEVIGRLVVDFPRILSYNLHKRIRPVVNFLLETAGVSEQEVGKVIAACPEIIGCSLVNKLESNVQFFLSLGVEKHQLGEMISNFPMLLKYNPPILQPKYRYLRRVMGRDLEDAIRFPRFFSYALEARIKPRHEALTARKLSFHLSYMLACSDEVFAERLSSATARDLSSSP